MIKIVLIGDSVRMGYDRYIKNSFEGIGEVYWPDENGKFAEYVLRYIHEWKDRLKWPEDADVVHWNAGLWDCLRLFDDEPLTPKEVYGEYVKRIDKRIRQMFPKAKIIFATNTSVCEEGYSKTFYRYNKDIEEYNEIAVNALKDTDTVIDDLYEVSKNCPKECRSDMTHFYSEQGIELIGSKVLNVIKKTLNLSDEDIKKAKLELNKHDERTIGY